ncbi:helix-turn-helix domain-containing protein [Streptomyces sp. NPDC002536]
MDAVTAQPVPAADGSPGELVRQTRKRQGLTLVQLGRLTGYSAAQVSRYERGISPLTDVTVLRRFADAPRPPATGPRPDRPATGPARTHDRPDHHLPAPAGP